MQQIEIQYFYPLTEQIPLDLDFTPCNEYVEYLRKKENYNGYNFDTWAIGGTTSGTIGPSTFQIRPDNNSVGYWEIGEGLQLHNKKKPSWLHRQMSRIFFGWDWKKQ